MSESALYCANHPNRETTLRCNKCEKPICPDCAVLTPVGYRCKECVRSQQKAFDTARQFDYPIAAVTAIVGIGFATLVLDFLGFWGLFVAPVAGGGVAEIIRWAVRKRRSRRLPLVAAIGGSLGVLIYIAIRAAPYLGFLLLGGGDARFLGSVLLEFLWPLAYGVVMISTLYYRLRGIRL